MFLSLFLDDKGFSSSIVSVSYDFHFLDGFNFRQFIDGDEKKIFCFEF